METKRKITVNELINTRFSKFMNMYDKEVDGADYEKTYRSYLNKGIQEMPYVHEVLSDLKIDLLHCDKSGKRPAQHRPALI